MLRMIVFKPDCEPRVVEAEGEAWKALQKQVHGNFDMRIMPGTDCTMVFNDDAAINGKGWELNLDVVIRGYEHPILGPVVIVRNEEDEDGGIGSVSVTTEDVAFFSKLFSLKNRADYSYRLQELKHGDFKAGMEHKFTKRNAVGSIPNARFAKTQIVMFDKDGNPDITEI